MANYGNHTPEEMEAIGVYTITAPSGKTYVGVTGTSFGERWSNHIKEMRGNRHKCKGLQRAYSKYGEDALVFSIKLSYAFQRILDDSGFDQELLRLEQSVWDQLKESGIALYNGRPTGTGSVFHTEESRAKILEAARMRQLELYTSLIAQEELLLKVFSDETLTWGETAKALGTQVKQLKRYLVFREEYLGLPKPVIQRVSPTAKNAFAAQYMRDHNLTREQFREAVREKQAETRSKTQTAKHFGLTIKEVSFICNENGRGPGLQRTHVKFHVNEGKVYSDCLYCLDTGAEVNMVVPTEEELQYLYVEERKTFSAIAKEYNISRSKVQQLLYTYDVHRE